MSAAAKLTITVVGAGVVGLWQALTLARRGHAVRLVESSAEPFTTAASRFAGAMLAPWCEGEGAEPVVTQLGIDSLAIWRQTYPGVVMNGSLVVAAARDRSEVSRFARMTGGYETVDAKRIGDLEPALADRFASGLFFADEGHIDPLAAMNWLLTATWEAGAEVAFDTIWRGPDGDTSDVIVDCRGLAARGELTDLRGVRGERVVVATRDLALSRPIRLLHPRHPLYVVPWGGGRAMIGATVLESEDPGPMTVRSALELLGLAYALHPAFGEAEILDMGAGVRPAYPDNIPRIRVEGRIIRVNGMYRHGFEASPRLAELVADHIAGVSVESDILVTA